MAKKCEACDAQAVPDSRFCKACKKKFPEVLPRMDDGASEMLLDMRTVYNNPPFGNESEAEKNQRRLLMKNPLQFNNQMARLEKELLDSKVAKGLGPIQKDGGSERIQALIKDCLAKIKGEK